MPTYRLALDVRKRAAAAVHGFGKSALPAAREDSPLQLRSTLIPVCNHAIQRHSSILSLFTVIKNCNNALDGDIAQRKKEIEKCTDISSKCVRNMREEKKIKRIWRDLQ